jgi:hypothetical protein
MYKGLDFDQQELSQVMREYYSDIIEFITQPTFQSLFSQMMELPAQKRPGFVHDVWVNPQ